MNEQWAETLSRLIDGDEVDIDTLREILDAPEGRRVLLDFATLRRDVRHDSSRPSAAFYGAVPGDLPMPTAVMPRPSVRTSRTVYAIAAALLVGIALGFAADTWRSQAPSIDRPPQVVRVLRFDPGEWTVARGGGR
jgi:hypothetical protein